MDVNQVTNGTKGARLGYALRAAWQCCDRGYDIKGANNENKYFVGDPCFMCKSSKYFVPVWNEDKSEVLKMNVRVVPWLKKNIPCFFFWMNDHWVVDFPTQADPVDKSDLVAGTLMQENTFM